MAGMRVTNLRNRKARGRYMTDHGRRSLKLAGECVLVLLIAAGVGGCSLGGPELSDLQPGDCFTGDVHLHPPSIEVIECSDAEPTTDYFVVFSEEATGDSYPGNLNEISMRCASEGGRFLQPSSSTWDDGDRMALCHRPPFMEGYFE